MDLSQKAQFRGVNLGGWLVLEKWITPSLYEGTQAVDETSFCLHIEDAKEILERHWESFITPADFKWIKDHGLNSLRIPVGYWIFGDIPPYFSSLKYLDMAMDEAKKNGLGVIIDLHTSPGGQNSHDHSGFFGQIDWHKNPVHMELTLEAVERLVKRYAQHDNLVGIEVLNEPSYSIPQGILLNYYQKAAKLIQQNQAHELLIIINDAFRPLKWQKLLSDLNIPNLVLDTHQFQCFRAEDHLLDIDGHLRKTEGEVKDLLNQLQSTIPVIVGEWSLGLHGNFSNEDLKKYYQAQIQAYNQTLGHFFWTYKTESMLGWSLKDLTEYKVI